MQTCTGCKYNFIKHFSIKEQDVEGCTVYYWDIKKTDGGSCVHRKQFASRSIKCKVCYFWSSPGSHRDNYKKMEVKPIE